MKAAVLRTELRPVILLLGCEAVETEAGHTLQTGVEALPIFGDKPAVFAKELPFPPNCAAAIGALDEDIEGLGRIGERSTVLLPSMHCLLSPNGAVLCQPRPTAWVLADHQALSPNGAALNLLQARFNSAAPLGLES